MKTSEVLDIAADRLEHNGWTPHPGDSSGAVCAGNAIAMTANNLGDNTTRELAFSVFAAALGEQWAMLSICSNANLAAATIFGWNDAAGRTAEEVIAMLRAVAMTERARERRLLPVVMREQAIA